MTIEVTEVETATATRREVKHADAKNRRDDLTARGFCINGETHGPATHGRRCLWCKVVHYRGVLMVLADPKAPPQPPGYKFRPRGDQRQPVVVAA
jgi:hypothetical protein